MAKIPTDRPDEREGKSGFYEPDPELFVQKNKIWAGDAPKVKILLTNFSCPLAEYLWPNSAPQRSTSGILSRPEAELRGTPNQPFFDEHPLANRPIF